MAKDESRPAADANVRCRRFGHPRYRSRLRPDVREVLPGRSPPLFGLRHESINGPSLVRNWPPSNLVFLPELAQAIIFEPRCQSRSIQPRELGATIYPISNQNVFRFKMIQQ